MSDPLARPSAAAEAQAAPLFNQPAGPTRPPFQERPVQLPQRRGRTAMAPTSIAAHRARDRGGDAQAVLRLLLEHGPATIDRISELMDRPPHHISGRFRQLEIEGAIMRTEARAKTRTGSSAIVWSATASALPTAQFTTEPAPAAEPTEEDPE